MKARTSKRTKDEALLTQVAESIGSALGTIVSKVNAAQKSLTRSRVAHRVERDGRRLLRNSKRAVRKTGRTTTANLKGSKLAKVARRGLRRATSSTKRAVRRGAAKARATRRAITRK
jgi:hypothetical protein